MNIISNFTQLAPVTFIAKQVSIMGGKSIVLLSSINPTVALVTVVALCAIAAAIYFYNRSVDLQNQHEAEMLRLQLLFYPAADQVKEPAPKPADSAPGKPVDSAPVEPRGLDVPKAASPKVTITKAQAALQLEMQKQKARAIEQQKYLVEASAELDRRQHKRVIAEKNFRAIEDKYIILQKDLEFAQARLKEESTDRKTAKKDLAAVQEKLGVTEKDLEVAKARLTEESNALKTAEKALAFIQEKLAVTQKDLEAAQEKFTDESKARKTAEKALAVAIAKLSKVENDLVVAQDKIKEQGKIFEEAFGFSEKGAREVEAENAELKAELERMRFLIDQSDKAEKNEDLAAPQINGNLSSSLSASLSRSWIDVSSEPIMQILAKNGKTTLNILLQATTEEAKKFSADVKVEGSGNKKVAEILCALMEIAHKKGEAFEEGSFICKDDNGNLAEFFTALATTRISSHLKGVADKTQHFGIDVPFSQEYFIPENKGHVLIVLIDQPDLGGKRILIKPENYGVTKWLDKGMHSVEFIHSLLRKVMPSVAGSDDAENYRKERIPQDLLKDYKSILKEIKPDDYLVKKAEKFGVSEMYRSINEIIANNHLSPELSEKVTAFIDKLEKMGDVNVRIGREVIIDDLAEICHKHFIEVASTS